MRLSDRFGEHQAMRFPIKIKNLSVAAPVHSRIKLSLHFILTEVLVEDVVEKLLGNGAISLGVQDAVDLLQNHDVFKRGLTEKNLAREDVSFRKGCALGGDLDIALFQCGESEQH